MKLTVIIPSFNGGSILDRHLGAVCSQAGGLHGGAEVVVVDDSSPDPADDTAEVVEAAGEHCRLLRQEASRGFAATCNRGAADARGELLLFLNNDMHPEAGAIATLVREFENRDGLFALSPVIVNLEEGFPESSNRAVFRRGVFDVIFPGRTGTPEPEPGEVRPLAYACGGAMICCREVFLGLGGFPEIHAPFYWEDADLGWRARRHGLESLETGSARVLHDHSRTIGALYTRGQVRRIYERNRLLFTWIHLAGFAAWTSHLLWILPRWFMAILRGSPAALALPVALSRMGSVRGARASLADTRPAARRLLRSLRGNG